MRLQILACSLSVLFIAGCGDGDTSDAHQHDTVHHSDTHGADGTGGTDGTDGTDGSQKPATYAFTDASGESSVSKSGQVYRQVLILELKAAIGALDGMIAADKTPKDVKAWLNTYYEHGSEEAQEELTITTDPPLKQKVYDDISPAKPANMKKKFAGNDSKTDHKKWAEGDFQGWPGVKSPEELLQTYFQMLHDAALAKDDNKPAKDPAGNDLPVHVSAAGHDLQQLVQKFATMAITFSQGTDDYLDDDVDGKGLKTSNAKLDGKAYSTLEHQWDEGFGYFGAATNYDEFDDLAIAGKDGGSNGWKTYADRNADKMIDLQTEYNFGGSVNAAKRDLGAKGKKTDFTKEIFDAFVTGRKMLADANGEELTDDQMKDLKEQRDIIVTGWEKAFAATVIHYINDTLGDMELLNSGATYTKEEAEAKEEPELEGNLKYSFTTHAKHWSEMKGFALGLQFNPRSPLHKDGHFKKFHDLVGTAPAITKEKLADYEKALLDARAILETAYGFDEANVKGW